MPDPETDESSATAAPSFEPDEGWVPADERLFGLDRRTIGPTLTVFALAIVMSVVLPVINAKIPTTISSKPAMSSSSTAV